MSLNDLECRRPVTPGDNLDLKHINPKHTTWSYSVNKIISRDKTERINFNISIGMEIPYEADSLEILGEIVDIYFEGDRYAEHNIPAQLWSAWHEYNESRREDQIVNKYLYADIPKKPKLEFICLYCYEIKCICGD